MCPVKNYRSGIAINRIFEKLQKTLVEHGAKQIMLDYGADGQVYGLTFVIRVGEQMVTVKLPARVDRAAALLKAQHEQGIISDRRVLKEEQAYRVAWRNILDWVEAQMALLDIEMVSLEEIFMPYISNASGKTLFEYYQENQYSLTQET